MPRTSDEAAKLFELNPDGDPAVVGYARISTGGQDHALQLDALRAAGCGRIYIDTVSGATDKRPALGACLDHLREGDTLTVWKLDRLGRSMIHLVQTVEGLLTRGVGFRVITQSGIDTTTSDGNLVFQIFAAFAEFERNLISERTRAGLDAARARGRKGGRKASLSPNKVKVARQMRDNGLTLDEIAAELGVSRSSVYRHLRTDAAEGEAP
ncbi:recombinase family protein [Rhodococcus olei]|uniref:Recombinase family protein n=1 Tax=Rhodococcus olei TaxID=2161675 RepID=A0ABP8NXV8_9NOCA